MIKTILIGFLGLILLPIWAPIAVSYVIGTVILQVIKNKSL